MKIKSLFSRPLKFFFFRFKLVADKWLKDYILFKLGRNPNIIIGKNVYIASNAVIETKGGGEIIIGDNTEILEGVIVQTYGGKIKIGKNCSINPYSILYGHGGLTIGDDVLIAGHCMLIPNNHVFDSLNETIREQGCRKNGIIIKRNVWIAHSCSILDGVTIEEGTVVAAGSVVNKSIEPNTVVGGVPAIVLKRRI